MTADTVSPLVAAVTAELAEDGWRPRWAACLNAMDDEYGNSVAVHHQGETVLVEFEYALPGVAETLHLAAAHGGVRIARVIAALAAAPE